MNAAGTTYFDHNATTPLDPRVREAMLPWLDARFGNPSSIHRFGQAAHNAVEEARERVAALLGVRPAELIFTASGSEANNTVIESWTGGWGELRGGHLVISAIEHPSIRAAAARAAGRGWEVTRVPPGDDGVVPAAAVVAALRPDTGLVCLMLANNELGTLQPVREVAAECRKRGIAMLCDAVQAVGKIAVDAAELGVDYLVLGAHKFGGPLGAAALWVRDGAVLEPLLVGGGQERRRRAGTENVAAIVGLGTAAELARRELAAGGYGSAGGGGSAGGSRTRRLAALRDRFETGLNDIPRAVVHCRTAPRLPNTSHIAIGGVEGEALLIRLDLAGYAVSTGSACSSGVVEPSQTLLAMGLSPAEALSSLRVSCGLSNTAADVDGLLAALRRETAALRAALGAGVSAPRRPASPSTVAPSSAAPAPSQPPAAAPLVSTRPVLTAAAAPAPVAADSSEPSR